MKKLLSLTLLLATLLTFSACGGDDKEEPQIAAEESKNILIGTKWSCPLIKDFEGMQYIEFISDTQVEYYNDRNNQEHHTLGIIGNGTYTINNNEIKFWKFQGFIDKCGLLNFRKATVSGNQMYVNLYLSSVETTDYILTFNRVD